MDVFAATMSGFEVDNAIKHEIHTSKNEVFQTIKNEKACHEASCIRQLVL